MSSSFHSISFYEYTFRGKVYEIKISLWLYFSQIGGFHVLSIKRVVKPAEELYNMEIKLVLMMTHNRKIIFCINVLHQMKQRFAGNNTQN